MAIIFLLKAVVGVDIFGTVLPNNWSIIDPSTSLSAFWLLAVFLMASGQVMRKELRGWRAVSYGSVALFCFLALIILNYGQVWWMALGGIASLLFVGFIFLREARLPWVSALFALLLATGIFIGFGAPKLVRSTIPSEVSLSRASSWHLVKENALSGVKEVFLGNGLGTFGAVFSKNRDPNFNNDQYAWSLRFSQPNNTIDAVIAEGGLVSVVTLVFVVLLVLGKIMSLAKHARQADNEQAVIQFFETDSEETIAPYFSVIASAVPWVILSVGMFIFFYGVTLWYAWWLLLGLLSAGIALCDQKFVRLQEYSIEDSPEYTLSFSFVAILVLAGVVIVGVWGVRMYAAENKYADSLRAATLQDSETNLLEAINYQGSNEDYHVALAQVYLLQAVDLSKEEHPNVEKIGLQAQKAVNEARTAATLAPNSVAVWENLAIMYENAAALIPEARDWAIKALHEARVLEPSNPVIISKLGNNMLLLGKTDEAIKFYEMAIVLKKDFLEAYRALATAYEQAPNVEKAISVRALLANISPSDFENLYNYGRLIYNRNAKGDRDLAEKIWLQVVEGQPNYSNALFSLGSLYESRGQKTVALRYFNKVLSLNPGNKEVKNKINALSK